MKPNKLVLKAETLRALDAAILDGVAGGCFDNCWATAFGTCRCPSFQGYRCQPPK